MGDLSRHLAGVCACVLVLAGVQAVHAAAAYTAMTDLGGQTVSKSGSSDDIFGNGGGISNGTLNVTLSSWWSMSGVTFTVGKEGKLVTNKDTSTSGAKGQANFKNGATLIIDGGTVVYNNSRKTTNTGSTAYYGFYLGDSGTAPNNYAVLRVQNGGTFTCTYQYFRVGNNDGQIGYLSVDDGTLNFPTDRQLIFCNNNSTAVVGLTNCTVKAQAIQFCESTANACAYVSMKDTTLNVQQIYKSYALGSGSYITLDGVTLNPQAANKDILANLGISYQLDGNLTVNATVDATASGSFSGTGALVKKGAKTLTLTGSYASTGALKVAAGTLVFGSGVSLAEGTVIAATDGTALTVPFANGAFAGTPNATLQLNADTTGSVTINISASVQPTSGTNYKLFDSVDASVLDRVVLSPAGYEKVYDADTGALYVRVDPKTHVWMGAASTNLWSTAANWDTGLVPGVYDTLQFGGGSGPTRGTTIDDLPTSTALNGIVYAAGTWTNNLKGAALQTKAFSVASKTSVALVNPPKTDPLPSTKGALSLNGVLDLGGASQTVNDCVRNNSNGFLHNGCELRNGTITVNIPNNSSATSLEWFRLDNMTLTVGPGCHLLIPKQTDRRGEINFGNAHLRIDGGVFENLNARNGAYVGNAGDAEIVIVNGGTFRHTNQGVYLGISSDAANTSGVLLCDNGTVDLGTNALYLAHGMTNRLASCVMTNSTLTCGLIGFSDAYRANVPMGVQTLALVDTTVTFRKFTTKMLNAASSITFDGATLIDRGSETSPLPTLTAGGLTLGYTVAAGGVTLKISDTNSTASVYQLDGVFAGTGAVTLTPQGSSPKKVHLTGAMSGFEGTFVAEKGITLVAEPTGNAVGGGLSAKAGATLSFPTFGTRFSGAVTLEDGVTFDGLDLTTEHASPVSLLCTPETISAPFLGKAIAGTRNRFFVQHKGGTNVLRYGLPQGSVVFMR